MSIDLAKLAAPFDPAKISWRVGATTQDKTNGLALAYIDARDVMERLDEVCGPANWQNRYSHAGQKTICEIGILINGEWVWKANGAGDSDVEAEKGASSDAFKRAAVLWGIGRYLYDIDSPWVAIKSQGRSYVINNPNDPKLVRALGQTVPPSNTGTGQRKPDGHNLPEAEMDHLQEYVALARLIKNQKTASNLKALGETDRFKAFCEVAPVSAGHLRAEYSAQAKAIKEAGLARAA